MASVHEKNCAESSVNDGETLIFAALAPRCELSHLVLTQLQRSPADSWLYRRGMTLHGVI